jgi:hypothetical protein
MKQIPKDTTLGNITFDTSDQDVGNADEVKILYKKPSRAKGYWTPTISGSVLTYDLQAGDLDEVGVWKIQAYKKIGTEETWSKEIKEFEVVGHL